jgi:ubiquinone/menaquinone biosynthesis C-methylase UbiE
MDVKHIVRLYWDRRSQTYDRNVYRSQNAAEHFWKSILKTEIGTEKNLNILDVGTGTGFLALLFAELGHRVTGIDISNCMLEKSRCNADRLRLAVDFMHGDAENLPFDDGSFDIVMNRYLLWTLPDPKTAVNEWSRVVKSGGKLILIDGRWHNPAIHMRLRRFIGSMIVLLTENRNPRMFMSHYATIKDQLPFFNGITPNNVVDLLTEVGLRNISVNNLEKLREFETKNRPLSYKIANKPYLFLAFGEK